MELLEPGLLEHAFEGAGLARFGVEIVNTLVASVVGDRVVGAMVDGAIV